MDSCSKQANFRDSKDTLVGVEETWEDVVSSRGSVLHSCMRWLIVTVLIGFVLMFFVVARQQIQISTMQLELNNLLHDEIDQLQHNYMDKELKNNDTETEEAVSSRLRRQVGSSQLQNGVPFAHLTQIRGTPRANTPYNWARPSPSRFSTSTSYYSNVQLYPSSGGSNVQAIQVARSGWYYVYAQVPYKYNTDSLLGHKIVKVGNCRSGADVPVLQTLTQLTPQSDGRNMQNWKYLGGIVHLAAGDHIEVRPATELIVDEGWLHTGNHESQTGGFFGLFEVQQQLPPVYRNCP